MIGFNTVATQSWTVPAYNGTDWRGQRVDLQAIAFVPKGSGDAVGVAKALKKYASENDALVIKGGVLGTSRIDAAGVKALAEVPPREQLLAELAGCLAAPMQQFVNLLDAVPRDFAYALNALIEKQEAAA